MTDTIESLCERVSLLEKAAGVGFKNVLTVKEVAKFLNKSERTIRQMMSDKTIPYYKHGGRNYFNRQEVEQSLLTDRVPTAEEIRQQAATYNVISKMTRQRRKHA